jgi:hypothetical protein
VAQCLKGSQPPGNLAKAIDRLDPHTLAFAVLTPLLDLTESDADSPSWISDLGLRVGEQLRNRLALANALETSSKADRLTAEMILADPDSGKGQRIRGRLKKLAESDDPEERAKAARVLALPSRRGRRRKSDYLDFLKFDWSREETLYAGGWLVDAVFLGSDLFVFDEDKMPIINPRLQPYIDRLREELLWRDPVLMPHTEPPPDWTDWRAHYGDRLSKTLVRDWRPETKQEIEEALADRRTVCDQDESELDWATEAAVCDGDEGRADLLSVVKAHVPNIAPIGTIPGPFVEQHITAVNTLQRIALYIDPQMVALVKEFAGRVKAPDCDDLIASADEVDRSYGYKLRRQHKRDLEAIKRESADAQWVTKQNGPCYLSYSLDRRGRVYANQHLNFGREDHIRALFKFERGMPIGADGISWLEIHVANSYGDADKAPWPDRIKWVRDNEHMIKMIAAAPDKTFEKWSRADKPFSFVAACIELAAAWADPAGFVTRLPVSFDGSANGIQHLALMMRDEQAAKLVNLVDTHRPYDVYAEVIARVESKLKVDSSEHAEWWSALFQQLTNEGHKKKRKLIKTPAMAFAYSITDVGMADDIRDVYRAEVSRRREQQPPKGADMFLAKTIREACKELLPGPAEAMEYIQKIARHCKKEDRFLRSIGPTCRSPAGTIDRSARRSSSRTPSTRSPMARLLCRTGVRRSTRPRRISRIPWTRPIWREWSMPQRMRT